MRVAVLIALAWLLLACGSPEPAADLRGVLTLSVEYVQPPPGGPMSIGGNAAFARLIAPDGSMVYGGEINPRTNAGQAQPSAQVFELPSGDYEFEVSVRSVSDAVVRLPNGDLHWDFGPVSATCSATVRISPPALSAVVVTLAGGSSCSISLVD